MKNLETMLARQVIYALIPLSEMASRSGKFVSTARIPISMAGFKY